MDSRSYTSSSSSSCESYPFAVYHQEEKRLKPLPSYLSSLHEVRRVPRPMTKKPIAPMPPTPPKIYKVPPIHFKEAVQMLTTEPGFQSNSRLLQDVAPPPLDAVPPKAVLPESACVNDDDNVSEWKQFIPLSSDDIQVSDVLSDPDTMVRSAEFFERFNDPIGFAPLSPSSLAWWASVLPSPGTLSPQLEASAVL